MNRPLEEVSEYFRVYAWEVGRVLSSEDVADVQKVLADYNDEIGVASGAHEAGYEQALDECGRADVAALIRERDSLRSQLAVEKAMHRFTQHQYEHAAANAVASQRT